MKTERFTVERGIGRLGEIGKVAGIESFSLDCNTLTVTHDRRDLPSCIKDIFFGTIILSPLPQLGTDEGVYEQTAGLPACDPNEQKYLP